VERIEGKDVLIWSIIIVIVGLVGYSMTTIPREVTLVVTGFEYGYGGVSTEVYSYGDEPFWFWERLELEIGETYHFVYTQGLAGKYIISWEKIS